MVHVLASHTPFGTVYGIGCHKYLRMLSTPCISLKMLRYLYDDIRFQTFYISQSVLIPILLSMKNIVVAGFYAMYLLGGHRTMVMVNYIYHDILDFHVHHPRHHAHNHNWENEDEAWQEWIAENLKKFFLYQIFYCHTLYH